MMRTFEDGQIFSRVRYLQIHTLTHTRTHTHTHTHTYIYIYIRLEFIDILKRNYPNCVLNQVYNICRHIWISLCTAKYHWEKRKSIRIFHYKSISSIIDGLFRYSHPPTDCFVLSELFRCPWCNGYRRGKWTRRLEFKSWTRMIAFHIALIPFGKEWIQLFPLQQWVNSRTDWALQLG